MRKQYAQGFTIIELLVVVAIIALLSSVILASLNEARARARDSVRLSDMNQLIIAFEFFNQANGRYPSSGAPDNINANGVRVGVDANLNMALAPYITAPLDPLDDAAHYYSYVPDRDQCNGENGPVLSFNRAETSAFRLVDDLGATGCGPNNLENQNNADYTVAF